MVEHGESRSRWGVDQRKHSKAGNPAEEAYLVYLTLPQIHEGNQFIAGLLELFSDQMPMSDSEHLPLGPVCSLPRQGEKQYLLL